MKDLPLGGSTMCRRESLEPLGWYGHVMRKSDKDWLEKCMAVLEIDRGDVHDRKKWRKNVMKRKSNPIGKRTINL